MTDYVPAEDLRESLDGLLSNDVETPRPTAVGLIAVMARSYTRGRGFSANGEPNAEIAAVITTASARLVSNTRQTSQLDTTGPFTQDIRSYFTGWTLAEQFVLNRYRTRAM